MDLGEALLLAAFLSVIDYEQLRVMKLGISSWDKVLDTVLILHLRGAMLLAALVTMVGHEHITVMVMGTSSL